MPSKSFNINRESWKDRRQIFHCAWSKEKCRQLSDSLIFLFDQNIVLWSKVYTTWILSKVHRENTSLYAMKNPYSNQIAIMLKILYRKNDESSFWDSNNEILWVIKFFNIDIYEKLNNNATFLIPWIKYRKICVINSRPTLICSACVPRLISV